MNEVVAYLKSQIGKDASASISPLMRWLNPTLISVEEGELCLQYLVREEMTNPLQTLHGGATAAIVDDSIGAAVFSLGAGASYRTVNITIDYFAPARINEYIKVNARIVKKGRQIINAECEIWNNDKSRLLAKGNSNLIKLAEF